MNHINEHLMAKAEQALREAGIGFIVIEDSLALLPTAA